MDEERNEHRKRWFMTHPELTTKHSMKRRKVGHDYCGVAIYMVTLCVDGRRPILGTLCDPDANHSFPWIYPSPLGALIKREWQEIPEYHPELRLLGFQLMPDHIHGIIYVTQKLSRHFGHIINGFKKGCNEAARLLGDSSKLWEDGYNDRILQREGQLDRWIKYVHDNPRRLWIKRQNPQFFTQQSGLIINNLEVKTMGNRFLLDCPDKLAVKCSRSLSDEEIESKCAYFLAMAARGYVLVSPSISPGEKEIMKRAFENGYPIILLIENGFAPLQKPSGRQFDACSAGRLLLIAPWPHHDDKRTITRSQCEILNDLAQSISQGDIKIVSKD